MGISNDSSHYLTGIGAVVTDLNRNNSMGAMGCAERRLPSAYLR